jgi:UDP-N-acetylmuramate dehydrogenase
MRSAIFNLLEEQFPKIRAGHILAPYTTFGIGGEAEYFLSLENEEMFLRAHGAAHIHEIPLTIIAGGSNLVVSDAGVPGLVVRIGYGEIRELENLVLEADAGVSLAELISVACSRGFAGLESLSGIPGTVGGAVVGNAGAYGQSISGPLVSVKMFDGKTVRELSKDECDFSYRMSIFKKEPWIVLSAKFRFSPGSAAELLEKSRSIIALREKKYAPGLKCPGSYFKNLLISDVPVHVIRRLDQKRIIEGKLPSGYLLEEVGAKGMKHGGAAVASFHGNLIFNASGDATFRDVYTLAHELKRRVKEKFDLELVEEVRYIG